MYSHPKKKVGDLPESQSQNLLRFYGLLLLPWLLSALFGIFILAVVGMPLLRQVGELSVYWVGELGAVVFFVLWVAFIGSWIERRISPQYVPENRDNSPPDDTSMDTMVPHAQYALGADGELIELMHENTPQVN